VDRARKALFRHALHAGDVDQGQRMRRWHVKFSWPEMTTLVERGCAVVLDVDRDVASLVVEN
jgi:hypothetical protein